MAITAAELQVRFTAEGARDVEGAIDRVDGRVREATGGFDAFFDSIQGGAGNALRALDGLSRVMGSIALVGGVTLIAGGARAAWQQVDAVQQATIALRAYEQDARAVDDVLSDLLRFARSDAGRLFMRQELFHAAQVMKVAGAETQNLSRYVEIMSRAVSTGMTTFNDLERVLARVVSTGRLTTIEFELLQQAGFMLDESLRNTTVTAEELFDALDRGSVEVLGQTETIQGRMMQLQTAIRGVGLAFLDVDSETSMFREGGLGDRIMQGLEAAPDALRNVANGVRELGNAIVGIIDFVTNMVNAFRMLPDGIQSAVTSILKLVAAFGALRVAGRAIGMVGGLMGLGGIGSAIGGLMGGGLFRGGAAGASGFGSAILTLISRLHPLRLAMGAVVAVGASWVNSFMEQKRAADELRASVSTLTTTFETLRRQGLRDQAARGEGLAAIFGDIDERSMRYMDEWYERLSDNERNDIYAHPDQAELERYLNFQEVSIEQQIRLNSLLNEALLDPNINVDAWMNWATGLLLGAENAEELKFAVDEIINTPLSDFAMDVSMIGEAADEARASVEELRDIFADVGETVADLRIDGLHRQANDIERLSEAYQDMLITQEAYWDDSDMSASPIQRFREVAAIAPESAAIVESSWQRISDALASGNFDNARLVADIMDIITSPDLDADAKVAEINAISLALHEYLNVAQDVLSVLGQGDLTSMLNLAGIGGEAVEAAANVNQLAASLDTLFRVIVGNTNAIASQLESLFNWADELIAEEGVWSKLDDLLVAGRITGEHGVFTGDSDYARAQQAYNQIAEANLRIQEHVLTIQAKQAPLLAANAVALEEYMAQIADMGGAEQLAALGFMDSALQEQLGTVVNLAGQFKQMGEGGDEAFRAMAEGIALTNPGLFAMMETIGLVTDVVRDADGTVLDFEVNLDGATTVQDSINDLIESIDALTLALGGIPPVRIDTSEVDPAIDKLNQLAEAAMNAVTAGLGNIGSGGSNDARTGSRDASTWGDTGVPVVTGLPQTGTGGTVTFTADHSAVNEAVERVSAMVAVVDGMEATVSIGADGSAYGETISQLSASLFAVNDWNATVQIYGDGSAYGETITEVWNSLMAVNDWSATVSILADASNVYQTISDLQIYQGTTIATSYVDIVTRRVGDPIVGRATGGFVSEDMTLVGERGPELVSLPRGSYVHTNAETMRMMNSRSDSGSGQRGDDNSIHINFAGATFSNTSRADMEAWAEEELVPLIGQAAANKRVGMGAT